LWPFACNCSEEGAIEDYANHFKNSPQIPEGTFRPPRIRRHAPGDNGRRLCKSASDDFYPLWRDGKTNRKGTNMKTNPETTPTPISGQPKLSLWGRLYRSFADEWRQPKARKRLIIFCGVGFLGATIYCAVVSHLTHLGHRATIADVTGLGIGGLLFLILWPLVCLRSFLFTDVRLALVWGGVVVCVAFWISFMLYLAHLPQPIDPDMKAIFCKGAPIATGLFFIVWPLVCFRFKKNKLDSTKINPTKLTVG
jgi:hypothetical protein